MGVAQPGGSGDRTVPVTVGLLILAGLGWWSTLKLANSMSGHHSMGADRMGSIMAVGGFLLAWVSMMAAMMLPAIVPAVRLFDRAATRRQAASTPIFVAGYLAVWSAVGLPVYYAWRVLAGPLGRGDRWAAYAAAAVLATAALYQVSPLKDSCLRHCRNPLSFILRQKHTLKTPFGALRAGISHAGVCLGCCWAAMAILVAVGTMNLGWMLVVAALIFAEKATPAARYASLASALPMAGLATVLFAHPQIITNIT